jgi:manganese/zinc/iron transport system ATP- binding protein
VTSIVPQPASANNGKPAIEISDLTVAYQHKPVLWEINLSVPKGVLGGIVGPNGAGKSTLIKAMLDLVPKLSGSVRIEGEELRDFRHRIAYVPQRESVDWDFPATVLDVVMMGLYREIGWFRGPCEEADQSAIGWAATAHIFGEGFGSIIGCDVAR